MSEEIIPEVNASDVELASPELEEVALGEAVFENVQDEETPDYQSQSLSELVASLQEIASAEERMKLYKRVEAIKSAFYRKLQKEKETALLQVEELVEGAENPFLAIEEGFKEVYSQYKRERAVYNEKMEQERKQNLKLKKQVIEDLKALIEKHGGKNVSSISGKTSFVLAGEGMGPAKLAKAQSLGIPILQENDFLALLNE